MDKIKRIKNRIRSRACICLAVVIVLLLSQNAVAEQEYPDALPIPPLTGNWREDIIAVALSQVGYNAAEDNSSVYWYWAGAIGITKSWCSEFVAWCANSANIPAQIIPVRNSSNGYSRIFAETGQFFTVDIGCIGRGCTQCSSRTATSISPYALECGDLLLLETNGNFADGPDHTCLVWKIEGDTLFTIDGNYKSGHSYGSVSIRQRSLSKKAGTFHGICRPQYPLAVGDGVVDTKQTTTKISRLKAGKKYITVTWKKKSGIHGYEIQYSTDKKFRNNTNSVLISSGRTTRKSLRKLRAKKRYYVRIRTYKQPGSYKIYSKWSKAKKVKTK